MVTIRDNRDYFRVLLYSYSTITGWGVLLWDYIGTSLIGGRFLPRSISMNQFSSHLPTCFLCMPQSTLMCVFPGLASGGSNPPDENYDTLVVPDEGLGRGVYGGRALNFLWFISYTP